MDDLSHDPRPTTLDLISSLVDQSLIQRQDGPGSEVDAEPRYVMLETIREYGLERLAAGGDERAARTRHAAYYHALAERLTAGLLNHHPTAGCACSRPSSPTSGPRSPGWNGRESW